MAEIDYSQMTSNMYAPWMQNLLLPADQQVNYFGNITTDIGTNLKTGLDEFFAENPAPSMEYKYPSLEELGLAGTTGAGAPLYGSYPQAGGILSGINNYIGSLAGNDLINKLPYQEDPRYADAYKRYTTLTGGNPDFYKTVSDLDTMTNLDWALNDMARARMDYTNGVLGGGGVLPQNQESEYFDRINNYGVKATPIGMINGTVIYSNTGDRPTDSGFYYLDGRDIMYQPEVQDDHWYDSGPLRAVAAVATGGLSELTTGGSVTDKIGSVMSGGLSVANEEAMGAIADKIGLDESSTQFLKDATGQFVPGAGLDTRQILEGIEKGSDQGFWAGLDRAVDPAGTIDYTTRKQGDLQNELVPELRPYYQPAGAIIGNIVWGPYGAAIGSGLGSKMAGGTDYYDYEGDFKNAGMAFLASDLTSGIDTGVSGYVSPTIGQTAGNIVGGAAKGAATGAISGAPAALETGHIDPVLQGAALGGVIGGVAAGAGELYNYFNPPTSPEALAYEYATENPGEMVQIGSPQQAMMDEAYFYAQTHPGTWVDSVTGEIHPWYGVGTPETMYPLTSTGGIPYAPANPSSMYPLDAYNNIQYAPAAPEVAYPLASNAERLNAFEAEPQFASDYIHPYELGSGHGADVKIGSTGYDPYNTYFNEEPSILSSVGKFVLDNSNTLLKLASILGGGAGATVTPAEAGAFPGGGRSGMPSSEAVTEFLMQHGGTGKGKSKGLGAGEVKGPYYGDSFMPGLRDIKKYDEQGLYYT